MLDLRRFVLELRRRRVLRTVAAYIVAGWVALQVADLAFASLDLPQYALSRVWLALFACFPLALIFSWRYDVSGRGIQRTPPTEPSDPDALALRRADHFVLGALGLAAVLIGLVVIDDLMQLNPVGERYSPSTAIEPNSIAVLPLDNLSGDPAQAYLAAGMHDALITNLSMIAQLRVVSRTSTVRISDTLSLPEIGAALRVAKVVEGSVTREGDRVRIIVQLIDAALDRHLWADSFESTFASVLSMQKDMAAAIARALEIELTADEAQRLGTAAELDPDTYDAYLKAMFLLHKDTAEAFQRGMEILTGAVENDPTSALAYAGLAYGYGKVGHSFFPDRRANPRLKFAAEKALELDDTLAEAHLAVGMYELYSEWDWPAAEASLQRALSLNPNLVAAHYHYAWLHELLGHDEQAIAAGELTEVLDPLSPFYAAWLADQYRDAGRYDEAIAMAENAISLQRDFPVGWYVLGKTYAQMGQLDEAIKAHERLEGMPFWSWARASSYALAGRVDEARSIILELGSATDNALPLAMTHAVLHDADEMFHWLNVARENNLPWYPWLVAWFDEFRPYYQEPEFQALASSLNIALPDIDAR